MDAESSLDELQFLLLGEIARRTRKNEAVLKGGMAMRTLHSQRMSKDMDFSGDPSVSLPTLQKHIREAVKATVATLGGRVSNVRVSEPKQTATVCRWKINGEFADSGAPFHLTIEISRRGLPPAAHIVSRNIVPPAGYRAGPFLVDVYDMEAMAASKVAALTSPDRTAPRDLYDLHVLIGKGVAAPIDLLREQGDETLREQADILGGKLDAMPYALFRSEVLPHLPGDARTRFSEVLYDEMRADVGAVVDEWLKGALHASPRRKL